MELIPNEKILEVIEFESQDRRFAGETKVTTSLTDTDQGTEVTILCENILTGVRPEDNELGTKPSLQKLAALLDRQWGRVLVVVGREDSKSELMKDLKPTWANEFDTYPKLRPKHVTLATFSFHTHYRECGRRT